MQRLDTRFVISIDDLRVFDRRAADKLMLEPMTSLPMLEDVLKEEVLDLTGDYFARVARHHKSFLTTAGLRSSRIAVGIEGNFGTRQVTPRSLVAEHLSQIVCLEGACALAWRTAILQPPVVAAHRPSVPRRRHRDTLLDRAAQGRAQRALLSQDERVSVARVPRRHRHERPADGRSLPDNGRPPQPARDRVRPQRLQGQPELRHPGNARGRAAGPAAALRRRDRRG